MVDSDVENSILWADFIDRCRSSWFRSWKHTSIVQMMWSRMGYSRHRISHSICNYQVCFQSDSCACEHIYHECYGREHGVVPMCAWGHSTMIDDAVTYRLNDKEHWHCSTWWLCRFLRRGAWYMFYEMDDNLVGVTSYLHVVWAHWIWAKVEPVKLALQLGMKLILCLWPLCQIAVVILQEILLHLDHYGSRPSIGLGYQ